MIRSIKTTTELDANLEQVFAFFADPINLEKITPDFLKFKLVDPLPTDIKEGTKIHYQLKLRGVPVRWISEITHWDPPYEFEDSQIRGPYRQWIHRHRFEESDGKVLITDEVKYKVPGWILEPIIHKFFVKPDLDKIFDYRNRMYQQFIASADTSINEN